MDCSLTALALSEFPVFNLQINNKKEAFLLGEFFANHLSYFKAMLLLLIGFHFALLRLHIPVMGKTG